MRTGGEVRFEARVGRPGMVGVVSTKSDLALAFIKPTVKTPSYEDLKRPGLRQWNHCFHSYPQRRRAEFVPKHPTLIKLPVQIGHDNF